MTSKEVVVNTSNAVFKFSRNGFVLLLITLYRSCSLFHISEVIIIAATINHNNCRLTLGYFSYNYCSVNYFPQSIRNLSILKRNEFQHYHIYLKAVAIFVQITMFIMRIHNYKCKCNLPDRQLYVHLQ